MNKININCDVGEGINNEADLMPYINSCNIACGGHAGNVESMNLVVELAIKNNVKIGAHPSYPDKENFGRKTMVIESNTLKISIQNQVNSLLEVLSKNGAKLNHIKPHGALYNDIAKNKELAIVFLDAILPFKNSIKLYVPFNSEIEKNAIKEGFLVVYEAFADRNYNNDLSLVSRQNNNAIISNPAIIFKHVSEMLDTNKVTTILGEKVPIKASTFCVHSDTNNAVQIVKYLHQKI